MKKLTLIISIVGIFFVTVTKAQSVKDSSFRILMVGVHFSGQLPQMNLATRYGSSFSVGGSFTWKTKKNILFGIEGSYIFGKKVKEDVVSNLRTTDTFIISNEGFPADLRLTHRGVNISGNIGYVFNKLGHNPNSGLFVTVGAGYMMHKVHFYDADKKVAAVKGNLVKGYDRLTGGFMLSQFIGYKYLSNNRLANFYFGLELYQGFTKSLRGINYNTGIVDNQKRIDVITGFRFGWILPLYKRTKDFYYY